MLICLASVPASIFFFFNDTATTEIYTLSLHDALPISSSGSNSRSTSSRLSFRTVDRGSRREDRKSTRLNSSHVRISYAVFCLKKKKHDHEGFPYSEVEQQACPQ